MARCSECQADLLRLPTTARFCPHCGHSLRPEPFSPAQTLQPSFTSPSDRPHSVMLLGYGLAMTGLAERYEAGAGVQRNEREAVRCYLKAARLGNPRAADRLIEKGIDVRPPAVST